MNNHKKTKNLLGLVIIATAMLLVAAGCQLQWGRQGVLPPEIFKGTQGIEIGFVQGTPPTEVYEQTSFSIVAELKNTGATDVFNGIYSLTFEDQYIDVYEQKQGRFDIRGKSEYNPYGEQKQLRFRATAKSLGPQTERYTATIGLNICYPYETHATLLTCIDTAPLETKKPKACTPKTQTFSGGQGAPVAVTRIEPKMIPAQNKVVPQFTITLQNLGSGKTLAANSCTMQSLEGERGSIQLTAMLSEDALNCIPELRVLKEGENKIVCTLDKGIDIFKGTYMAPLTVELKYDYAQAITRQVLITKPY